ncbi:Cna B-type domain-containing protein, partial [bacterium]|nr:Cna B-type domain-containing protein [bacterium]
MIRNIDGAGVASYTLLTNTVASLEFADTRPDGAHGPVGYDNPPPVTTSATEMLALTKDWTNYIDDRDPSPVTVYVLKDGEEWFPINLNSENNFKGGASIAVGIMTVHGSEVKIKTTGHDYSFGELGYDAYNWELKSPVIRPMLINSELTILVRYGEKAPEEGTYYKIGDYYYIVGSLEEGVAQLTATNERRSWIDLTKEVTYTPDSVHFDDQVFNFNITVNDKEGEDLWFSIKESADGESRFINSDDGLVVTNATPETKVLRPSTRLVILSVEDGYITYTYDGVEFTVKKVNEDPNDYEYYTGYYYVPSGTTFSVSMKAGWNLRVINLLTGTTYTIEEYDIDNKFEFNKIDYTASTYVNDDDETVEYKPTITNQTVEGEVKITNFAYGYTYNNKNVLTEVTVVKEWSDNNNNDGARPTSVRVQLYKDNVAYRDPITLSDDNDWTYTWTELPQYSNGENKAVYTVRELVEGLIKGLNTIENKEEGYYYYSVDGSQADGYVITNEYIPQTTSVTVSKIWDDNNNQDGKRPESIVVTLSNGDTVTLSDANNWSATIDNLPVYANGEKITYTWDEGTIAEYNLTDTTVDETGYVTTLTNTHVPETTSVTVSKIWDDNNNQDGKRPESIVVTLSNGDTVTLSDANNWSATIDNLPVYANGEKITYTWDEGTIAEYNL